MTSPDHVSGTDRIAEAVKDFKVDIVANIQGDEPLISPDVINNLVKALRDDPDCPMATVVKRIDDAVVLDNPNIVKAVIDKNGYALYFSRYGIPYNREGKNLSAVVAYKHLGLYAYRKDFLMRFNDLPFSRLEHTEKLEQLRVLEAGYRIKAIQTTFETVGVDTPEDLDRVARLLGEG
jgi:3-deoxy-manno-octulosonate cytidylyltransferase (CMP-KDO synthetase)